MSRLIPEKIEGDVNVNVSLNIQAADAANAIGKNLESLVITCAIASVMRSWFRKK